MAEKITIELDLEAGDVKGAVTQFGKVGERAGKEFSDAFKKDIGPRLKSIASGIAKTTAAVTALGSAFATAIGFKAAQAAQVQEDAIRRLNGTLASTGDFTEEASRDLQAYAAELQQVTRFGDEVVINQLALAKSFGATNEQAKQIAETATGLSQAFGIDLESATRNVAKTLGGYAGELGETIPQLKELTTEQLRAGAGIELLSQRFADQGKNLGTFSFFVDQAQNTFGDLLEEIGKLITQSPLIIKGLSLLNKSLKETVANASDFVGSIDLGEVIVNLSKFGDSMINFVVAPAELAINILKVVQGTINTFVSGLIAGFARIGGVAGQLIQVFSPDSELAQSLRTFSETSQAVFEENANSAIDSLTSITDFPVAERMAAKNEEFRTSFQMLNQTIQEESELAREKVNQSLTESSNAMNMALTDSAEKTTEKMKQVAKQANNIVKNGIVNSISGGIQNIVASLANGENAFQNFGAFILNTFGDLAIQLGQFFIAQGIAIEALNAVSGTGAIAAGAALVALGSILKSFSSSGGSSSSGGGGVAAAGAQPAPGQQSTPDLASPENLEAEERVNLSLNVEGSLVRESELAGFVSNLLEESGSRDSTVIPSLRTA